MALPLIIGLALKGVISTVLTKKLGKVVTDKIAPAVLDEVIAEIGKNPVVLNELNAEHPAQSRIVVGSSTAIIGAIGVLAPTVAKLLGFDISTPEIVEFLSAIMVIWGPLYALYGRLSSGLKPLFSKA